MDRQSFYVIGAAAVGAIVFYLHKTQWQQYDDDDHDDDDDDCEPVNELIIDKSLSVNQVYSTLTHLKHTYFAVRHGESEANVARIVSCDPVDAVPKHGLTGKGRQQAIEAAHKLNKMIGRNVNVYVYASDFRRALETGTIIQSLMRIRDDDFHVVSALRERDFGDFHGLSNENYDKVWYHDARSVTHTAYNCESLSSVLKRTTALVAECEREYSVPSVIIFATHGDICGILRAGFMGLDPRCHKLLPNIMNCEIVPLKKENQNHTVKQ